MTEDDVSVRIDIEVFGPSPTSGATVSCVAHGTPINLWVDLEVALGERALIVVNQPKIVHSEHHASSIDPEEHSYTIVEGDSLGVVAQRYGIPVESLANYNSWPEGITHELIAGEVIKIPPGSKIPDGPQNPISNLFIGDLVALGAAEVLTSRGYTLDASPGRQMEDMVPVMEQLERRGLFGNLVVIHLGNNGPIDAGTLDALLEPLEDVPNVVILNVHANRSWAAGNNELLAERDQPADNITLIDWATLASQCPGQCFTQDGVSLTDAGVRYYADVIGALSGL